MKRTGILRKPDGKARLSVPARQWTADELPGARVPAVVPRLDAAIAPQPKDAPRRSEAYRRYVASLNCAHCGRAGPSQCAHSDEGKGLGIKASDETCFPLCADAPGRTGCHTLFGASGYFTQRDRRTLERSHSSGTQKRAKDQGQWPEGWK